MLILFSAFLFNANAQYPVEIPYQGTIADTGGTAYDGTFDFKFELKDKHGVVKWSSGIISLDVHLGAYAVSLGAAPMPAIYDTCFKRDSLELFTSFDDGVNGMETMSPSVKLKPVPYAVHSRFADRYCGDSLHTYHIHSYWIHGYWFWGWWGVFDSIHVKKVVVDSLYVQHLFVDTIVVDIICVNKIKLDDPAKGESTTIESDGIISSKKDPVSKEIDVTGVLPDGIVIARIDSTGKVLDSTIITSTMIKTRVICADSIKTEDPVTGAITSMTSKGTSVQDSSGNRTDIGPGTLKTDTLKVKVICADSIKAPTMVITDPNDPNKKTKITGNGIDVEDGTNGSGTQIRPGETTHSNSAAGTFPKNTTDAYGSTMEDVNGNKTRVVQNPDGTAEISNTNGTSTAGIELDGLNGEIDMTGDVKIKNDLEVCGDLKVKGIFLDSLGNPAMDFNPHTGQVEVFDLYVYNNTNTDKLHVASNAQVKGNLEVCSDLQLKGNITDTAGNPLVVFDYVTGDLVKLGNFHMPFGPPPGPNHVLTFDQFGNGQWQDRCIPCGLTTNSANQTSTPAQALPTSADQSVIVSIDHPLDPKNKTLNQAAITSPEMLNVYNGNITTDGSGEAIVKMPAYVEKVNTDFRYQLTVIGTFAQAIVFKEVSNGQFVIKTDQPNVKVSWQVTGVRTDAYARENSITVEEAKTGSAKGNLLYTPTGKVATK